MPWTRSLVVAVVVVVAVVARPPQQHQPRAHLMMTGASTMQAPEASAEDAYYTMPDLWRAVPRRIDYLGRNEAKTRTLQPCRYCIAPPQQFTPGLGDGAVVCYWWSPNVVGALANYTAHTQPQKQCSTQTEAMRLCLGDREPDAAVDIFGSTSTYVRNGRMVWKNPDGGDFHAVQGYMVHPPEGGKERVEFKIKFELDLTNNCPRPHEERQKVEWAVFYSQTLQNFNVEGNFELLDSGSFAVARQQIELGGKSGSEETLYAGGFTGAKAIMVWLRVSFTAAVPHTGALSLIDTSEFAFFGECLLECANGGELDALICKCTCPTNPPWKGKNCSECGRECRHGFLDVGSCTCGNCGPFVGDECEICPLNCGSTGEVNENTCVCACKGNWEINPHNGKCSVCPLTCQHGGVLDSQRCQCSCPAGMGWGGKECEVCTRVCVHGDLDTASCTCGCDSHQWEGTQCHMCNRECHARGNMTTWQDPQTCTCHECPYPWDNIYGEWCHICNRKTCGQHGRILNATLADGSTERYSGGAKVRQRTDSSKLDCWGTQGVDCECCCDPILPSHTDTCGSYANGKTHSRSPDYLRWTQVRWELTQTQIPQDSQCLVLPDYCPGGDMSENGDSEDPNPLTYPLRRCDCKYNWQGRICDCCYHMCGVGGSQNTKCQCDCAAGYTNGPGMGDSDGQCNYCIPEIKTGAVGSTRMTYTEHHNGYPVRSYGLCGGTNKHFCKLPELSIAAGLSSDIWTPSDGLLHHYGHGRLAFVGAGKVRCLAFHLATCQAMGACSKGHSFGGSWNGFYLNLYIKDGSKRHLLRRITKTSSTSFDTHTICAPQTLTLGVITCGPPPTVATPPEVNTKWVKFHDAHARSSLDNHYWSEKCQEIPSDSTMVKFHVGGSSRPFTYIRPKPGNSWCTMLTTAGHDSRYEWSHNGWDWVVPDLYGASHHWGGSLGWWPVNTIPGWNTYQTEAHTYFWGIQTSTWASYGAWARGWHSSSRMWYTKATPAQATTVTFPNLYSNGCVNVQTRPRQGGGQRSQYFATSKTDHGAQSRSQCEALCKADNWCRGYEVSGCHTESYSTQYSANGGWGNSISISGGCPYYCGRSENGGATYCPRACWNQWNWGGQDNCGFNCKLIYGNGMPSTATQNIGGDCPTPTKSRGGYCSVPSGYGYPGAGGGGGFSCKTLTGAIKVYYKQVTENLADTDQWFNPSRQAACPASAGIKLDYSDMFASQTSRGGSGPDLNSDNTRFCWYDHSPRRDYLTATVSGGWHRMDTITFAKMNRFKIWNQNEYSTGIRDVAYVRIYVSYAETISDPWNWVHVNTCPLPMSGGRCPNDRSWECPVPDSVKPARYWEVWIGRTHYQDHSSKGGDPYSGLMGVHAYGCPQPWWGISRNDPNGDDWEGQYAVPQHSSSTAEYGRMTRSSYDSPNPNDPDDLVEVHWQNARDTCSSYKDTSAEKTFDFSKGYPCDPAIHPECPYPNTWIHPNKEEVAAEASAGTWAADPSTFDEPLTSDANYANHGAYCCANDCSGTTQCSTSDCKSCPSCGGGQFREGCMGLHDGTCKSCSASCAAQGLVDAGSCGRTAGEDGCKDP